MNKYKRYTTLFRVSTIISALLAPIFLYCVLYVSPWGSVEGGMPELTGMLPRTLSGFLLIAFVILSRTSYKLRMKHIED